jgi:hypothetical protein
MSGRAASEPRRDGRFKVCLALISSYSLRFLPLTPRQHAHISHFSEWRSCFIVWARSTSPVWRSRRYRRRIVPAGKSGSGINMSVRRAHSFSLSLRGWFSPFFFLGSLSRRQEGGFLPGPFVSGGLRSGGDSAAQVHFLPPSLPTPRPRALRRRCIVLTKKFFSPSYFSF